MSIRVSNHMESNVMADFVFVNVLHSVAFSGHKRKNLLTSIHAASTFQHVFLSKGCGHLIWSLNISSKRDNLQNLVSSMVITRNIIIKHT